MLDFRRELEESCEMTSVIYQFWAEKQWNWKINNKHDNGLYFERNRKQFSSIRKRYTRIEINIISMSQSLQFPSV